MLHVHTSWKFRMALDAMQARDKWYDLHGGSGVRTRIHRRLVRADGLSFEVYMFIARRVKQ